MSRKKTTAEPEKPKSARSSPRKKARVHGGGYAFLLMLAGLTLLGGGLVLSVPDQFSWQLVKLRRMLAPYGVEGSMLAFTGLAVLATAFTARAAVRASKSVVQALSSRDQVDQFELLAGQLATDLANVRHALARVGETVAAVAANQNQLVAQMAEMNAMPDQGGDQREGLFRLAASLDKLGAQMDERLHGLDAKIREKIDHVAVAIDTARSAMQGRMSSHAASTFHREAEAPQRPSGIVYVDEQQSRATPEELDVLVELEKELLDGKEPNLEFFDAVEDFDSAASNELRRKAKQLDLESPPSPFNKSGRKDGTRPSDEGRRR